MNELSVIILTFNEEDNIARCLDSVKTVADEIVVVDSFSTDDTQKICHNYNLRFIEHHFLGYIEQKNYALDVASNDYVLCLDADEELSTELQKSILNKKENFDKDGYYLNRLNNYLGKWIHHGAWYPDRKLRLFNKLKARWGGQNPHDTVKFHESCSTARLKGNILHYSYKSIDEHIAQLDKFTTISAKELYVTGRKPRYINLFINPLICFIKGFFLKLCFLDGYYGILICVFDIFATYIKYAKLREIYKTRFL